MIPYISYFQLSIEEFKTPFQTILLSDNSWVVDSEIFSWGTFACSYIYDEH